MGTDDFMRNLSSTSIFVENTMLIYLAKLSILKHSVREEGIIIGANIVNIFDDNIAFIISNSIKRGELAINFTK